MPPALRTSAAAHVMPLVLFMAFLSVPGWFKIENSELPWHIRQPELWVYPLQCLACGVVMWLYRRHYQLAPWRGLGLAVILAVLGIGFWIAPAMLRETLLAKGHESATWWEWLGMAERMEGFDPMIAKDSTLWFSAVIGLRFLRMVVIVPLVEELFWRGWLMRYLVNPDRDFSRTPFGTHSWRVFCIVTVAVMLIHQTSDWLGAAVWGSLVYLLAVRSKSLGACVLMHALGNLLLGLYVMKTGQWGFW
jgi:uncharacterized protein